MPVRESASTRITFASTAAPVRRLRTWGAVLAAAAVLPAGLLAGCGKGTDDAMSSIVRTTTNIAGAGVVGLERDTRAACALPSSPDATAGTVPVNHTAGITEVPADAKRVVVLSTAALDAVCALGLWERVVGAATVSGPTPQPSYLGTGVLLIPQVGTVTAPDPAKVAELKPDLILGSSADSAQYDALKAIAPTVLAGSENGWQAEFSTYGAALDRKTAATKALEDYRTAARDAGNAQSASLTQASVLRFDPKVIQVQGGNSFAGLVLGDAGVQRPQSQRGNSYDVASLGSETDRNKVEGDIIFLMFDGKDGQKNAESIMHGDDWKSLSAVSDRREFVVEDSIWHGSGITAARAILEDLKMLNAYVSD
ncbi:ABC transporter substrate-binding protein [Nocardia sp. NPDC056000]|uniref:ABC transporter substrate-binding protein n=1 Tax=Nocardia sp. NPDC056000 TaxID=3345674 RepID=UPI0035DA26C5